MISNREGLGGSMRWLGVALLGLSLPACGVWQQIQSVDTLAQERQQHTQTEQERFRAALGESAWREASQNVDRPWLAGRPQPLAREVTLPRVLRDRVQTLLLFPERRWDLETFAERVGQVTGIPVKVAPEALLPAADFMPRLEGLSSPAMLGRSTAPLPEGSLPLPDILDQVAAKLLVEWRYAEGVLQFYRTESRVFNVRSLLLRSKAEAALGRSSGGTGAFAVASQTRVESDVVNVLESIGARLQPLMTRAGRLALHGDGSSLVVVNDSPAALARIADFLDQENRALTRRVRLLFEEVSVVLTENAEAGIDWSLLYSAGRVGAALAIPGLTGEAVSSVLDASVESGPWQGSRALVQALNRVGTVVRHTSVPLVTLNRRPVTHAVRTTFSWIDKVQTTALAGAEPGLATALPNVSISQKEETVGQFLTLIPDAQADGQILLQIAYDTTVAQPLTSVKFGTGDNAIEVQQLTVDGNGTVQQVELRPGQPMIVSGFERRRDEAQQQRADKGWPVWFGGVNRARQERETTVVIITAIVEEGF